MGAGVPEPTGRAFGHPGRRALLAAAAGCAGGALDPRRARARRGEPVDVALVLAVDVSLSVDEDGARRQREGYRAAVADPMVLESIQRGAVGAVGLAYVEWAGIEHQRLVLPGSEAQRNGKAM